MGGEYTSKNFWEILAIYGTIYQSSCINTPEQNGVAERKHQHIIETARSLLSVSVPSEFWGGAAFTVVYLINKIPSMIISGMSTFENLFGYVHDCSTYGFLEVLVIFFDLMLSVNKLSSRSVLCVILGYGDSQKGIVV